MVEYPTNKCEALGSISSVCVRGRRKKSINREILGLSEISNIENNRIRTAKNLVNL
jgi:hypothetical protein